MTRHNLDCPYAADEAEQSAGDAVLKRLAAQRALLLEHVVCGVVLLGPDGAIAEANTLARQWLGLGPDAQTMREVASETLLDPATLRPVPPEDTPWARALAGAIGERLEVVVRGAGGREQWLRVSATHLAEREALEGVVVVLSDFSIERRLARDLAATATEHAGLLGELTEHAQRLAILQQRFSVPSGRPGPTPTLTAREREVLALLAQGLTNAEIARGLDVTTGTARVYVKRILAELGVSNRTQAALRAVELGLSEPPDHAR